MSSGVGSYVGNTTGRKIRLEWEITQSPSSVSSSTSSVSVRTRIWVRTQVSTIDSVNDFRATVSSPFTSASGSRNITTSSGGRELLYDKTKTVSTGSSSKKISLSSSLTRVEIAGLSTKATVSGSHTIAARPSGKPSSPSNLAVARGSDTQHIISGRVVASSTVKVTRLNIMRRESASTTSSWDSWKQVGSLTSGWSSSTDITFTDTSTVADRLYQYQLVSVNTAGTTTGSAGSVIRTTPAVPPAPVIKSETLGEISAESSVVGTNAAGVLYDWSSRINNVEADVAGTTATPSRLFTGLTLTVPHAYRIRATADSGTTNNTSLVSDWSGWSNAVAELGPPGPPTLTAPVSGAVVPYDQQFTFAWVHNTYDTSSQRGFQLEYRVDEGDWESYTVTSPSSVFLQDPIGYGAQVEWRVRTRGIFVADGDGSYGPWSAVGLFILAPTPEVTLLAPSDPYGSGIAVAEWSWFSEDDTAQSSWQAVLWDVAADIQMGEALAGTVETTATFGGAGQLLSDVSTYEIRLRARGANGLWADVEVLEFTTRFLPPTPPYFTADFDCDTGSTLLEAECTGTLNASDVLVAVNLATNPSFERVVSDIPANVGNAGTTARSSTDWAQAGVTSLRMGAPRSGGSDINYVVVAGAATSMVGQGITFVAGRKYTVKITCYLPLELSLPSTSLFVGSLMAHVRDSTGQTTVSQVNVQNVAGTHALSLTVDLPANTTGCEIRLYNHALSGNVYYDALLVAEGDYSGDWFDGSSQVSNNQSVFWAGLANDSVSHLYNFPLLEFPTDPLAPITTETAFIQLQRKIGENGVWVPLTAMSECGELVLLDRDHPVGGTVGWRAVSFTAQGAAAPSLEEIVTFTPTFSSGCVDLVGEAIPQSDAYFSAGPAWEAVARLSVDLEISEPVYGPVVSTPVSFAGRTWPLLYAGMRMRQELNVAVATAPEGNELRLDCGVKSAVTLSELRRLVASTLDGGFDGPRLWRDATGRRLLVGVESMGVTDLSVEGIGIGWHRVTISLVRVDDLTAQYV